MMVIIPLVTSVSWLASMAYSLSVAGATPDSCLCSYGSIPVPVDVKIPVDPTMGLNTTDLRRLETVYNIFGVFCQPAQANKGTVATPLCVLESWRTHRVTQIACNSYFMGQHILISIGLFP